VITYALFDDSFVDVIYLVAFVVLVLATARLTRLVSRDDLTASWRLAIDRKLGENSFISRLIWCHWCSAVWVSLGTSSMAMQAAYSWGNLTPKAAVLSWLLLIPANAYAAAWVVDKEGE
jgi:hypothetical protein